jgi:DNA-binding MarR family transcriptional regulator
MTTDWENTFARLCCRRCLSQITIRLRNEFKVRSTAMPNELRPSRALRLWHDVVLDQVHDDGPDLSARQQAVLLTVYLEPPPHTVRGLAKKLKVTKPAITRALDSMGQLGLLTRRRDPKDRRNVVVLRTLSGALAVERLGDVIVERFRQRTT